MPALVVGQWGDVRRRPDDGFRRPGADFLTNSVTATLTGNAWVDLKTIRLADSVDPLPLTWDTPIQWRVTVPLQYGANPLVFLGYGYHGQLLASNQITIASTVAKGRPDADHDGLPDEWETRSGLDPLAVDAALDADHDGLSNLAEYLAGTDPLNPQSVLRLLAQAPSGGQINLSFLAMGARTYTVQQKAALAQPWMPAFATGPFAANQLFQTNLTLTPNFPARFFQLTLP